MPDQNDDLYGSVPDECSVALLIIDMINDFEFPDGEAFFAVALPVAEKIAHLKNAANQAGIPVIYVNDNFGKWRSDFHHQVNHCLDDGVRGEPIVHLLKPEADDYSILKPKHSAFYATPLDLLLSSMKESTLILTGIAADVCILFTASDAYMRDYRLVVPADCIASKTRKATASSLEQMKTNLNADIRLSTELDLAELKRAQNKTNKD